MLSACGSKPEFELVEQDPKIRIQFEMLNDGQSVDIGENDALLYIRFEIGWQRW